MASCLIWVTNAYSNLYLSVPLVCAHLTRLACWASLCHCREAEFTFKVSQRHGGLWNSISRECNEEERHEKWFMCERASHRRLLAVSTLTQIIAPTQTSKGSSGDGPQRYDFPRFHYKKHKYTVQSFSFFCSILSFSFTRFHFLPCLLFHTSLPFSSTHSNKTAHIWFSFPSNIKDPGH